VNRIPRQGCVKGAARKRSRPCFFDPDRKADLKRKSNIEGSAVRTKAAASKNPAGPHGTSTYLIICCLQYFLIHK
jgi:hypothetical protein